MAWLLTRAINQYDQDGHYAISVFSVKPSLHELDKVMNDFHLKHWGHGKRLDE